MPNWTSNSIKFTTIEDCPKNHIADENSCIITSEEKPWFNWYTWHNEYWGVKWNASDVKINTEACEISFYTPWATPDPIFEVLAKRLPKVQ